MPKRYKTIVANELPKVDFAAAMLHRMQSAARDSDCPVWGEYNRKPSD